MSLNGSLVEYSPMNFKVWLSSVLLAFAVLISPIAQASAATAASGPSGAYRSDCLSQTDATGNTTYTQFNWLFLAPQWSLVYTINGDKTCTTPLLDVVIDGSYKLIGSSAAVPGAMEAEFNFDHRLVVPYVDPMVSALNSAKCGTQAWETGVGQEHGSVW